MRYVVLLRENTAHFRPLVWTREKGGKGEMGRDGDKVTPPPGEQGVRGPRGGRSKEGKTKKVMCFTFREGNRGM